MREEIYALGRVLVVNARYNSRTSGGENLDRTQDTTVVQEVRKVVSQMDDSVIVRAELKKRMRKLLGLTVSVLPNALTPILPTTIFRNVFIWENSRAPPAGSQNRWKHRLYFPKRSNVR